MEILVPAHHAVAAIHSSRTKYSIFQPRIVNMSSSTTTVQDDSEHRSPGRKSPRAGSPKHTTELKFFLFTDPADARTAHNKKLVRSHVARTTHARTRHARSVGREAGLAAEAGSAVATKPPQQTFESTLTVIGQDLSGNAALSPAAGTLTGPEALPRQSFAGTLSPWEQSLLDHYINVLIPKCHSPCDHPWHPIDVAAFRRGMAAHWVDFCLTDIGLLQEIFLASCRDLARLRKSSGDRRGADVYERRALQYRGECLLALCRAMPQPGEEVTDVAVAMALFLAFNESMVGELEESRRHMDACKQLVQLKGGHETLGLDGFLSQLILWFEQELSAQS